MTFTKVETEEIQKKYSAQKVEFDIDKTNLLRDVISKQTGSLNKAIKEMFQNSFDAGATEIRLDITAKGLRFRDNGCGMNEEEINNYFRVFGATEKRGDSKQTGAFGMGRGQAFNFGKILWKTQKWAMVIDIKNSLSYTLLESNKYTHGTDIIISFYKRIMSWNIGSYYYSVKHDVLPPEGVAIYLDGILYSPKIRDFKNFSNDDYFVFTSIHHTNRIYNGYLAVKYIRHSNYAYSIMPYEKLELNFARNELIEGADSTERLMDFIYDIEEKMAIEKKIFDKDEALNILKLLNRKRITIKAVYDKKIVLLANGKLVSFKEIIEKPNMGVLFGEKNIWSDDCLRNDYQVISTDVRNLVKRINDVFDLKIEFLDKDVKELSRKGFHREVALKSLTRNKMYFYVAIELNDYIFTKLIEDREEEARSIHLGLSDLAAAWTNPYIDKIWINKTIIQGFQSKEEAIIRLWEILCHEYAHDSKNIKEDYHNQSFYEQYEENISNTTTLLASALKYITRKYIKEKYEY